MSGDRDSLSARGVVGAADRLARRGALAAIAVDAADGVATFLTCGHVVLPLGSAEEIAPEYPAGVDAPDLFVQSESAAHTNGGSVRAKLIRGTLPVRGGDLAWGRFPLSAGPVEGEHPVCGFGPPFAVRTAPLFPGDQLFQWSPVRNGLVGGIVASKGPTSLDAALADGRFQHYPVVISVKGDRGPRFAVQGDSGSLVFDLDMAVVGLCVAVQLDDQYGYVVPLDQGAVPSVVGIRFFK